MTPRSLFLGACVVLATAVCVRLGFWQLSRRAEKHALHAAERVLLALEPVVVSESLPEPPPASGRRVRVRGRWDASEHVLLSGRTHLGAAGVWLVSGVRLPSGERVLVERGWLAAADSRTARPPRPADSTADVSGVALALERSARPTAWSELPWDAGGRLWSARALDADSAAARFGGGLAPWIVRALPEGVEAAGASRPGGAPGDAEPIPEPYQVPDEAMHLSYAIQWFGFAVIIAAGSIALAARRRAAPR